MDSSERRNETDPRSDFTAGNGACGRVAAGWYRVFNLAITDVFLGALALYLILLVIEVFKRGSAAFFMNLNSVMWVVLGTGVLAVLTSGARKTAASVVEGEKAFLPDVLFAVALGVGAAVLILLAALRLGSASLLLSMGVGLILILIAPLIV